MSLFSRNSPFSPFSRRLGKRENHAREVLATFNDEENQVFKHNDPTPTTEGPAAGELERWYYLLNSLTTRGVMDPQDWQDLDDLRDEIYRFLR